MLTIPMIQTFIEKGAIRQPVADMVDHLNYFVTACLLGFFALATSAKQYFGSPIQCWVPDEFNKAWESYAEDICFIQSSYYIPFDEEMPKDGEARHDHISYYRWVPIMLALQCMFFYLPNFIWNILHRKTSVNPEAFLKEAEKLNGLVGAAREEELSKLAKYFMETVSIFGTADTKQRLNVAPRSGKNTMRLYLLTKTLYVVNIYCQVLLLSKFLGENYLKWGYESFRSIVMGTDGTKESSTAVAPVFPRVIMCDFQVRELGNNIYTRSIQCVLMMNMINEKLYLFLYFWFIFLSIVTFVNFCYYIAMYALPKFRRSVVLLKTTTEHKNILEKEDARYFDECLHPDGVLLLQFLAEHVSGRVAYDVASKVLELYENENHEVKSCRVVDRNVHSLNVQYV